MSSLKRGLIVLLLLAFLGLSVLPFLVGIEALTPTAGGSPPPSASPSIECDLTTSGWYKLSVNTIVPARPLEPGAQCLPTAIIPQLQQQMNSRVTGAPQTPPPHIPFASPTKTPPRP